MELQRRRLLPYAWGRALRTEKTLYNTQLSDIVVHVVCVAVVECMMMETGSNTSKESCSCDRASHHMQDVKAHATEPIAESPHTWYVQREESLLMYILHKHQLMQTSLQEVA